MPTLVGPLPCLPSGDLEQCPPVERGARRVENGALSFVVLLDDA
jgi:hypothetical protein